MTKTIKIDKTRCPTSANIVNYSNILKISPEDLKKIEIQTDFPVIFMINSSPIYTNSNGISLVEPRKVIGCFIHPKGKNVVVVHTGLLHLQRYIDTFLLEKEDYKIRKASHASQTLSRRVVSKISDYCIPENTTVEFKRSIYTKMSLEDMQRTIYGKCFKY